MNSANPIESVFRDAFEDVALLKRVPAPDDLPQEWELEQFIALRGGGLMTAFFVGLDLAQPHDSTALAVLA